MFVVVCLHDLGTIFLLLTLTLKMEAACSTGMFVSPFKTMQYHNSEDHSLVKEVIECYSGKGSLTFRFRLKQLCSISCIMRTRLYFRVCILNFHLIE